MTAKELKKKYLDFFVKKGHKKLPNASLIPENDPTALFINSGMHPLVPYLLGESHPLGNRLCSLQRCVRTGDIEEVGDTFHHTFFEMLGNWSLGDYWKKEALNWSWEFLTKELNFEPERIFVTCFGGDKNLPKDEEAAEIWRSLGVLPSRIFFLGIDVNWWAVGKTGPCGPCSEMYYDTGRKPCGSGCQPGCDCDKYIEIWNDVFMEFNRLTDGKLEKLKQQNIDTGMGVERTTAVLQKRVDNYQTELFSSIIRIIEELSQKKYQGENQKPMRVVADHLRAATFMMADGVMPSNVEQGYILRRLIRRAIFNGRELGIQEKFVTRVSDVVVEKYQDEYSHLEKAKKTIEKELEVEEEKSAKVFSVHRLDEIKTVVEPIKINRSQGAASPGVIIKQVGKAAFDFYATHGTPPEIFFDVAEKENIISDADRVGSMEVFEQAMEEHQEKSRASLEKKFAGGLADHSEIVTKLHTATHLLHQALRDVLGNHVQQVGSNITPDRLRFDFTHPEKLSEAEIKQIEEIINKQIKADLPVKTEMMTLDEAKKTGALAFFTEKYGEKVKVYSIGPSTDSTGASTELNRMSSPQADSEVCPYSREVCGGPHVSSTGEIGGVKIIKERPTGAGRRRIYARLS